MQVNIEKTRKLQYLTIEEATGISSTTFYDTLHDFFQKTTVHECEEVLNELLEAWIDPQPAPIPSAYKIATVTFMVNHISNFITKVGFQEYYDQITGTETEFIMEFFCEYGLTQHQDLLSQALQVWIFPGWNEIESTQVEFGSKVIAFNMITNLIRECDAMER